LIGFLSGTVLATRKRTLILDTGGVGYEVFVNKKLLGKKLGSNLKLWIHTHQTSDAISLFGFEQEKTLEFFELLMSVNGVGPKTALEILEIPFEVTENIIVSGDTKALSRTPGIGAKTAARIVLELKPKLTGSAPEAPADFDFNEDALEALTQLGYKSSDVKKALSKLPPGFTKPEEIVKWFLRQGS
jgi:Holliday junction DNA helicase RuvA